MGKSTRIMKKLLWIPQLSNLVDGKFCLDLDSNHNLFMGRLRELIKNTDWDIYYVLPSENLNSEYTSTIVKFLDEFEHLDLECRFKFLYYPFNTNPFATRFDFSFRDWDECLGDFVPDVCVINDPCLVKNFRTFFYTRHNKIPGMISYNHFIDNPSDPKVPSEISYWDYQVAGATVADLNVFTCRATERLFLDEINLYHSQRKIFSSIWDAGYSAEELESHRPHRFSFKLDKDITYILFPNRISSYQDYTNGLKLLEACDELFDKRQDFRLICANPTQKYSNQELKEKCRALEVLVDRALTKDEYYSLLYQCDLGASLYTHDRYGGCAMREYVAAGTVPIMTNYAEYGILMDEVGWPKDLRVHENLGNLVDIIDRTIDMYKAGEFNPETGHTLFAQFADNIFKTCSHEMTTKKVIDNIEYVHRVTS